MALALTRERIRGKSCNERSPPPSLRRSSAVETEKRINYRGVWSNVNHRWHSSPFRPLGTGSIDRTRRRCPLDYKQGGTRFSIATVRFVSRAPFQPAAATSREEVHPRSLKASSLHPDPRPIEKLEFPTERHRLEFHSSCISMHNEYLFS